jgi:hypothetical protein
MHFNVIYVLKIFQLRSNTQITFQYINDIKFDFRIKSNFELNIVHKDFNSFL